MILDCSYSFDECAGGMLGEASAFTGIVLDATGVYEVCGNGIDNSKLVITRKYSEPLNLYFAFPNQMRAVYLKLLMQIKKQTEVLD